MQQIEKLEFQVMKDEQNIDTEQIFELADNFPIEKKTRFLEKLLKAIRFEYCSKKST